MTDIMDDLQEVLYLVSSDLPRLAPRIEEIIEKICPWRPIDKYAKRLKRNKEL